MGAPEVLTQLRASGLSVTADDGRLIVRPVERITDETRATIREYRPLIMAGLNSERAELTRLVRQCGDAYAFTEQEHAEALAAALTDPVDALTCFSSMAATVQNTA